MRSALSQCVLLCLNAVVVAGLQARSTTGAPLCPASFLQALPFYPYKAAATAPPAPTPAPPAAAAAAATETRPNAPGQPQHTTPSSTISSRTQPCHSVCATSLGGDRVGVTARIISQRVAAGSGSRMRSHSLSHTHLPFLYRSSAKLAATWRASIAAAAAAAAAAGRSTTHTATVHEPPPPHFPCAAAPPAHPLPAPCVAVCCCEGGGVACGCSLFGAERHKCR